jgi:hypothetical protein
MDSFISFAKRTREDLSDAFPLEQSGSPQYLNRRAVTPAVCYDDCGWSQSRIPLHRSLNSSRMLDLAYKIALSTGKSPELCSKDSPFQRAYSVCNKCIMENTESQLLGQDGPDSQLGEFIIYCAKYRASPSSTAAERSTVTGTSTKYTSTITTSPRSCKVCSTMTITGYDGKLVRATIDLEAVTGSLSGRFYQ